jgi:hypothetical protein
MGSYLVEGINIYVLVVLRSHFSLLFTWCEKIHYGVRYERDPSNWYRIQNMSRRKKEMNKYNTRK